MKVKTIALIGVATLGMSGLAFAEDQAIAAEDQRTNTYTAEANDAMFVVDDFTYTLSANVGLNTLEDTGTFTVGTASSKGRNAFTGSSNGGSVSTCGPASTGNDAPTVPTPSLTLTAGCSYKAPTGS